MKKKNKNHRILAKMEQVQTAQAFGHVNLFRWKTCAAPLPAAGESPGPTGGFGAGREQTPGLAPGDPCSPLLNLVAPAPAAGGCSRTWFSSAPRRQRQSRQSSNGARAMAPCWEAPAAPAALTAQAQGRVCLPFRRTELRCHQTSRYN